jgi:glycosyltransferase involved in cell wall biosynthesis
MKYVSLPPLGGVNNIAEGMRYFLALTRELRRLRPAVTHFIYLENVLLGGIASRIAGCPAVIGAVTGLGSLFAEDRLLYKIIRRLVMAGVRWGFGGHNSVLAFENLDDKGYFVNQRSIKEDRTAIIPGAGVPKNEILPSHFENDKPVILFASRMIRNKGIMELVSAAEELHRRGVKFELWLVGDVDTNNPTSFKAEELREFGKLGFVSYLGYRDDVAQLMQRADIFCLPTYYREGLPRVIIEACAAGKPIVTTDVPGCREIVHNNVNGFIVPPQDHDALVHALEILACDKDVRILMGTRARHIFEERFTLDAVLLAFNQCYRILDVPLILK